MKLNLICILSIAFASSFSFSQTQNVSHLVDFNSGVQNMWGPSWSPFSIDQEITLFNVPWNLSASESNIVTVAGQSFGAGFAGGFSGVIGSKVSLEGFTTGTVEVDYPIDIDLEVSADNTYDQGDPVVIETDYSVQNGYDINSLYPSAGEFKWDVYFQMAANASATLCFFGCTTFPIIPTFDTGLQTINVATVSGNGASTGGQTGAWWLGAGDITQGVGSQQPGAAGWPYALPPQTSGPYNSTTLGSTWIPWQNHLPFFPVSFGGPLGLTGELTLPYVETTTVLTADELDACGDSSYFNANLEIFKLLGGILSYSPPPGPAIGLVLENLTGSLELGPVELTWNFFSASMDARIFNNQCFNFDPKVFTRLEFPVAVDYQVYNNTTNSLGPVSTSSIINMELGNELRFDYPCHYAEMDITPTYYISGSGDNFSNRTYDSIAISFLMSAFQFGISVPGVIVIPGFTIPEICVPIPYPCPTWSNPFRWCSTTVCTPEVVVPPIASPEININPPPLIDETYPIADIQYDWYNNSWNLEGFSEHQRPAFKMIANQLGISNTQFDINCFGDLTGSIDVTTTAISSATPFSYVWTNGGNTEDLSGLSAGPYALTATDGNGCQLFTGATILEPQQPLGITFTKTDKNCNGGPDDGSIDILVQGGTAGYTYLWSNGETNDSINSLAAGTYTLTVTDDKGCMEQVTVTIGQPNVLGQVGAVTDVNCFGDATGIIDVDVFGGVLPYVYSWDSGQTSEDLSLISAGTYTLTLLDGNDCESILPYNVGQPIAPLTLSSAAIDVACNSDFTGSIDLTTLGGTAGYTYQWSTGLGIVLPYTSEDIVNIPADNYTVLVTDFRGCEETITQLVDEPIAPLSDGPVLVDILCFGDITGSINPNISGGTASYSYLWSNGFTGPIATGLASGVYSLTVTDGAGCADTYTYTLSQPSAPLSLTLSGENILCFGDATGSTSSEVAGGTPGYSFLWSNTGTSSSISNLIAGNYSLTITDSNGCSINDDITLLEPLAPLALSSLVTEVDCFGNNSGSIDLTVVGGTAPYLQYWSNGGGIVLTDTTEDISSQFADDYEVLVTDDNGCTLSLISTISEPVAPLAISGIVNDANCYGLNDGAIDITVTGGTINYTYSWSSGQTTEDISGVLAGQYIFTVTDLSGCVETMTFNIAEPIAPLVVTTFPKDVLCNGGNDGELESNVTGGTLPYSYLWSNGEGTEEIYGITAGPYTLTITDDQGCVSFTGAVVNEPTALVVLPTVLDASCFSYSDGEITIDISGGVEPYYFNWGNQNEILLNNPSETITGLIAEDYFIRVRDENGCILEQTVSVGEPQPFIAIPDVFDVLCNGGNDGSIDLAVIGGTIPYSTVWSDGQVTEDAFNLAAGVYIYEITDDQGCIISDSIEVTEPSLIQISYDLVPVSCIDQTDASIFVTPYGGTVPYSYLWSTGSTDLNAEELAPATYDITITDDHFCSQVFSFEITMNFAECVVIPNTFTPNGDHYNDTWVLGNIDLYPGVSVKIFNKWGNEVFTSIGTYSPWDGTQYGNPLPSEVYYYIITLGNDEQNEYTGTVTIIR
ncbi:gliding motility-associated C-terminal domain-containing protein [Crocinitomicaceae bacterium]|nr:gliding motility-associated C-terminal domain-containing protein [Crocinitomicaceae bacterium]